MVTLHPLRIVSESDALRKGRGLSKVNHIDACQTRVVIDEQQRTANQLQEMEGKVKNWNTGRENRVLAHLILSKELRGAQSSLDLQQPFREGTLWGRDGHYFGN